VTSTEARTDLVRAFFLPTEIVICEQSLHKGRGYVSKGFGRQGVAITLVPFTSLKFSSMRHISLLFVALALCLGMNAQIRTCHTMGNLDRLLMDHPEMEGQMRAIEKFTRNFERTPQLRGPVTITIPVVVNVIYKTGSQNISDAQIQSQIDVLNEDFRRTNGDANNTWSQAIDTNIEFCLASIDPDGNPTTGIRRKSTSKPSFSANDAMKSNGQGLAPWDPDSYLNIWVCNLGSGLLGYAQFPGGPASTDGVVVDYAYFGTIGTATAPFNLGRTATHEVGHYLNLRHIWGDGGCSVDDFVSDTPASDGPNYGCAIGHVSCGSVDMVQNYMDYSDDACMNLFTEGQSVRMDALFASGGARASLANSNGCGAPVAPTCDDGIQNGDETGVDCGGSTCPACPEPTCNDGIQNGDETGVDCGGSCNACPATCDDGIQNGDETGVDCGGTSCSPCDTGGSCEAPAGTEAVNIRRKRADLTWSPVAGALDYTVQFRAEGQTTWTSEATVSATLITASSLNNNTTYEWQVRSNCASGSSDYAPACSFTAGDINSSSCAGARLGDNGGVEAYPNPTGGRLTLNVLMEAGEGLTAEVLDAAGRVVYREFLGQQTNVELDLNGVPSGMYFIQVTNGVSREVIRVMRE
jgi:hypothetical protein